MSIASSPRNASIAAAPVSPEVAPITVACAPLRSSARFISRATTCMARSLKASVGPWNSSRMKLFGAIWRKGATAG